MARYWAATQCGCVDACAPPLFPPAGPPTWDGVSFDVYPTVATDALCLEVSILIDDCRDGGSMQTPPFNQRSTELCQRQTRDQFRDDDSLELVLDRHLLQMIDHNGIHRSLSRLEFEA